MVIKNIMNIFGSTLLTFVLLLQSHLITAAPLISSYNLFSGNVDQGDFKLSGSDLSSQYRPSDNQWALYPLSSNFTDTFENFDALQTSTIPPQLSGVNGFKAVKFEADDSSYVNTALGSTGIDLKGIVGSTGVGNYYLYLKILFPALPTSSVAIFEAGTGSKKVNLVYSPNTGSGAKLSYVHGSSTVNINNVSIQSGQWYALEIKHTAGVVHLTIQNTQVTQQTASVSTTGFSPDDDQPYYFGKGQVQGTDTYFDGYMKDLIIRRIPLPSNEVAQALALEKTFIRMKHKTTNVISDHDDAILTENDDFLNITVPRVASAGNYDLSVVTPGGVSNVVPFTVKDIEIEQQGFVDNFDNNNLTLSRWTAAHKAWGGDNGGVSEENVVINSASGEVVITANGDNYTGTVSGVDKQGNTVARKTRVGGSLVSRKYFGPGEFIIEATVPPLTGVASAFWLIHYEEGYPGHPLYDEMLADGLHLSGNQELGYYIVRNHEIDIEVPTALKTDPDTENVSFSNGRFNTWWGELRNWDVTNNDAPVSDPNYGPVNDPAYWSEYTDEWINHGKNITDGAFHEYRIKWMLDDGVPYVEYYIDGTLIKRIETHVPFMPQKLWLGMWFPSASVHWAGRGAPWDSQQMRIRRFEYIPETTVGASYVEQGESYPVDCFRNIASEMSHQITGDFNGDGIQDTFNQANTQNDMSSISPQSRCLINDFHKIWTGAHPDISQIADWSADTYGAYSGNFNANPGDELLLLGKRNGLAVQNAIVSWDDHYSATHTTFNFDAKPEAFDVHVGDLTGDGYDEIFLQRRWKESTSYILNNQGGLIQTLADGFLNIDWSSVFYSAQVTGGNIVLTPVTYQRYVFEGQPYSFTPPTSMNATTNVTYSAAGMPNWMSMNTATGEISGIPATGDIGQSHQVIITVSDNNAQTINQVLISLDVEVVESFVIGEIDEYTVYEAADGTFYLETDNGVDFYKVVPDNGTSVILKITQGEFNAANTDLTVNYEAFIKDFNNDKNTDLVWESLLDTEPRIVVRHLAKAAQAITRGDTITSTSEQEPIFSGNGNLESLALGINGVSGWAYDPNDQSLPVEVKLYQNGVYFTTVTANIDRPDLRGAANITGNHGFAFTIPENIDTNGTVKVDAFVVLNNIEEPIGTRYFITARTGSADTTITATTPTGDTVSVSTNENGDFTAWDVPADQTYSVEASKTDACFSPAAIDITTTGIIEDVVFTEITCDPLSNSEFSHTEVDYKSVLPGMDIVRVNPMLSSSSEFDYDTDGSISAYYSGWSWNFETYLSYPGFVQADTSTLFGMGIRTVLRDADNGGPQANYDRGVFYKLDRNVDDDDTIDTVVDLRSDTTTYFKREFHLYDVPGDTINYRYQRLDKHIFRDKTEIAYEYEDVGSQPCSNLSIRHVPSQKFIYVQRTLLGGADTPICVPTKIILPDGDSEIDYQWDNTAPSPGITAFPPRLMQVTYPDGNIRQYQYNDQSISPQLTKVIDEEDQAEVNFDWEDKRVTRRYAGSSSNPQAELAMQDNVDGTRTITDMEGISRTQFFEEWVNAAGVNFRRTAGLSSPCSWCGTDAKAIEYNDIGLVTKITSQRNVVTNIIRNINDPLQRETSRVVGAGESEAKTIATTYHPTFKFLPSSTDVTDSSGSRVFTQLEYDDKGRVTLVRVTDTAKKLDGSSAVVEKVVTLNYTEYSDPNESYFGQVQTLTIDGPRPNAEANDVITLSYNTAGLLISKTDHLGTTRYEEYDDLGLAHRIEHPNGTTTNLTYDLRGRVLTRETEGVVTTFTYYKNGLLHTETTPGTNEEITYTYDAANRLQTVTDSLGNRREINYDPAGRPILFRDGNLVDEIVSRSFTQQYDGLVPRHGSVTIAANGDFTYTPDANYAGADSFSYMLDDGQGGMAVGQVDLTINAAENVVDNQDTTHTSSTGTWTSSSGSNPYNGNSVYANVNGESFQWNPDISVAAEYNVAAWWTYHNNRDTTVIYKVHHVNGVTDVTVNQRDNTLGGQWNELGNFTLDQSSFVEIIHDGGTTTTSSADAIRFSPISSSVNSAPIAQNDTLSGNQGSNITGNVLANNGNGVDSDPDGDTLSVVAAELVTEHGSVTIAANGDFTYVPAANSNYVGAYSFSYTLDDGQGGTDTGLVNLTINTGGGNTPVVIIVDNQDTTHTSSTGTWGSSSGADPYNGNSVYANVNGANFQWNPDISVPAQYDVAAWWTYFNNRDTTVTYKVHHANGVTDVTVNQRDNTLGGQWNDLGNFTLNQNSFVEIIHDGGTDTSSADAIRFTSNSTAVNAAPVAQNDTFSGNQGSNITGNVLIDNGNGVDSDPDGDTLAVVAETISTTHGSVTIAANGDFTYTPDANYIGADSFNYTLDDGQGGIAVGQVNLTINPAAVIVDNQDATHTSSTGTWTSSSGADPYNGNSVFANVNGESFQWNPDISVTGEYNVAAWWTYFNNRDTTVIYKVHHINGVTDVTVNQRDNTLGGQWNDLGNFTLDQSSFVEIVHDGGANTSSADAIRFVPISTSVNSAPIAKNDVFTGNQGLTITGNVLVDNGNGADSDPNGDVLTVVAGELTTTNRSATRYPTDFSTQKQVSYFNEDFDLTRFTDEMSKTTTLTRDDLGRVTRSDNIASGLVNQATFDVSDNVVSSIYSGSEGSTRSQSFQYTSDSNAAIWELLDIDTGTDTAVRDKAGNIVDASNSLGGNRVTSTYDPLNRITHSDILDPNTSQVLDTVDYQYDNNPDGSLPAPSGLLTQITGSLGEVKYFYNNKNHLIKKTQNHSSKSYTDSYSYDNAGRILSMTYPSGRRVEYARDAIGQPNAITTRATTNSAFQSVADQIDYAPFATVSNAKTLRYGGGTQIATRLYDTAGRVQSYSDGSNTVSVGYRPDGLISTLSSSGATLANYDYDQSNRLKSASGVGFVDQQFVFESTGDLKSITVAGGSAQSLSYPNNSSRLSAFAGNNLSYVQDGLVSSQGNLVLTYNSRGLIATAKKGNGVLFQYGYDPLGQRQSKTNTTTGEVVHYHYDISGRLIAESNPTTDETLVEYIWLGNRPIMMIVPENGAQPEARYFIYTDYSNTPIRITNTAGQTVWQWQRNPFGSNGPVIEQITFNLRMPGQYYDAETGLHYNGARYYNPVTGRYMQPDPFGEAAGVTAYTYANGNPVNFTDPTGLFATECSDPFSICADINVFFGPFFDDTGSPSNGSTGNSEPPQSFSSPFEESSNQSSILGEVGEPILVAGGGPAVFAGVFIAYELLSRPGEPDPDAPDAVENVDIGLGPFGKAGVFGGAVGITAKGAGKIGTVQKILQIQRNKGNFNIGSLTSDKAAELGRSFVGPSAVDIVKNGKTIGFRSPDGLRQFRFPAEKLSGRAAGKTQANIEEFFINGAGQKIKVRNAHIDIIQ